MRERGILEELRKLPPAERLVIIEAALQQIREELQEITQSQLPARDSKAQLSTAAEALFADYATDSELTSFKALDSEDLHA